MKLLTIFIDHQPPVPLATFQNNVNKIEKDFYNKIGTNNEKVFPKLAAAARSFQNHLPMDEEMTVTEELKLLSKPVKTLMQEQKF